MAGWGSGSWGAGPWGGEGVGSGLALLTAQAVRENVIRLEFSEPLYFSTFLEPADGSDARKYVVEAVDGSAGSDGEVTREVSVVTAALAGPDVGVSQTLYGSVVDLTLDRPMTSFPSIYTVTVSELFSSTLVDALPTASLQVMGVFKQLDQPTLDSPEQSRDIANPQTLLGAISAGISTPDAPLLLGTYTIDDTGDYALDSGQENLRKRVLRRLMTKTNGFMHLADYGVGVPQQGKKLTQQSVLSGLAAKAEKQIALEPDVAKVRVVPKVDPNVPGLVRFQILVRPVSGPPRVYEVPFKAL